MDTNNRANTNQEKFEVITRLYGLWLKFPELRLGQLIGNVYPCGPMPDEIEMKAALAGDFKPLKHKDAYNVEDFDFISELEKAYDELKEKGL